MKEQHLGSDFDEHLEEEGLLEETESVAAKRVFAYQVAQAMEEQGLSKSAMADHMGTSRSSLDRLLDPEVPSVTLATLQKAARALGKRVQVEMVDPDRKWEPMGQESWERFKAELTNRLIERHYAVYLQHENNPIHALLAYRVARAAKVEIPDWILSMLDQWAEVVYVEQPRGKDELAAALGLSTKSGASVMAKALKQGRDLRIVQRIFQLRTHEPDRDKLDIFHEVAEEYPSLKSGTVQNIWYEQTRGLDVP